MKPLKKYAYMSPETEVLSLETKRIIMEESVEHPEEIPPIFGPAPLRY